MIFETTTGDKIVTHGVEPAYWGLGFDIIVVVVLNINLASIMFTN